MISLPNDVISLLMNAFTLLIVIVHHESYLVKNLMRSRSSFCIAQRGPHPRTALRQASP